MDTCASLPVHPIFRSPQDNLIPFFWCELSLPLLSVSTDASDPLRLADEDISLITAYRHVSLLFYTRDFRLSEVSYWASPACDRSPSNHDKLASSAARCTRRRLQAYHNDEEKGVF